MQKKENNQTQAAMEFQSIVRNNIRMILARFPQKQESFALSLQLSQASISKKLNGKADWTSADIANAAEYFNLPFYVLVSPTALKDYLFADTETEYQLQHNVATDIPRRELAASAGVRYFRRPDDTDRQGGADSRPRFFVMPETNQLALRAPNSQNGRLALRAPESRLDEKACIAMLAIAVSKQNLAILVTIPSFGERP